MFDRIRDLVLRWLRVPHEPAPPAGAPDSVRVFRAGRNFYKLKLAGWGVGQVGALIGIVVSLWFLAKVESVADTVRDSARKAATAEAALAAARKNAPPEPAEVSPPVEAEPEKTVTKKKSSKNREAAKERAKARLGRFVERSPWWVFPLISLVEYAGVLVYLVQIPITYAIVRLDYEQRWYIVTDRSLRIRSGITTVLESTMSFANLQQVVVTQGPLQRLLGLADVKVQSAGGGGESSEAYHGESSLHSGVFHGVENAEGIRDLILERLRKFRQAGLGDPDDPHSDATDTTATPAPADTIAAAQELLAEARALRQALTQS